jgi:hypothetical protein
MITQMTMADPSAAARRLTPLPERRSPTRRARRAAFRAGSETGAPIESQLFAVVPARAAPPHGTSWRRLRHTSIFCIRFADLKNFHLYSRVLTYSHVFSDKKILFFSASRRRLRNFAPFNPTRAAPGRIKPRCAALCRIKQLFFPAGTPTPVRSRILRRLFCNGQGQSSPVKEIFSESKP